MVIPLRRTTETPCRGRSSPAVAGSTSTRAPKSSRVCLPTPRRWVAAELGASPLVCPADDRGAQFHPRRSARRCRVQWFRVCNSSSAVSGKGLHATELDVTTSRLQDPESIFCNSFGVTNQIRLPAPGCTSVHRPTSKSMRARAAVGKRVAAPQSSATSSDQVGW